jgi:SAM-dependent methyltransferase
MTQQEAYKQAMRRRRSQHARRTAETQAAFLLPHLRPGMALLDLGCGPGSITTGLAAAVAPGPTTGVDVDPLPIEGVEVVTADVMSLPFPDASFDAIFASALLQHLPDPLGALREARRVARPGAVIGVVDADWDGELFYPTNDVLRRWTELALRHREGTSPFVGKQLRHLLAEAGFARVEGYARVVHHGTADLAGSFGRFTAALLRDPETVERSVAQGWATVDELEEMSQAWLAWSESPGAFATRYWCEAIGWAE